MQQNNSPSEGGGQPRIRLRIPSIQEVQNFSRLGETLSVPAPAVPLAPARQQAAPQPSINAQPPAPISVAPGNFVPPSRLPINPDGEAGRSRQFSGPGAQADAAAPSSAQPPQNAIIVSNRQKGNSVLKHIRNCRWVFGDIVPDYQLSPTTVALYISLKFHMLHQDYLFARMRELQRHYRLRILICHVDLQDAVKPLGEVTKLAVVNDFSLFCAWSREECARYLETFKCFEKKPADMLMQRKDTDYMSRLADVLTCVRGVNRTDAGTLGRTFKTLKQIMNASLEQILACPGIGEQKAKRLHEAFHQPFLYTVKQPRITYALSQRGASGAGSSSQPQAASSQGEATEQER
eukprot:jgi/Mesvir1/12287/Mv00493-RA.1